MFTTDALAAALAGRYTIERLVGEGGMAQSGSSLVVITSWQQLIARQQKATP